MNREFWTELLASWLKSMGVEKIEAWCSYKGQRYKFTIGKFDGMFSHIDVGDNSCWAEIDLNIDDVDPCDPSFDPDEFFAPFKEWMDNHD